MPNRSRPTSQANDPSLDELARLLASSSSDTVRIEACCKRLRVLISRKYGVPFYETEDIVHQTIESFLEELQKSAAKAEIISGRYLWGIARNRHFDRLRMLMKSETSDLDQSKEDIQGSIPFAKAKHAYEDKQEAISLHIMAHRILKRLGEDAKAVLGKDITKILETMQLMASHMPSSGAALSAVAAQLIEDGVLTPKTTRNIKKRLQLQPELRRALSMPRYPAKPTKPKPSAEE
jgi:DNA-directed RNA polymerase specialized sigma24 family protein